MFLSSSKSEEPMCCQSNQEICRLGWLAPVRVSRRVRCRFSLKPEGASTISRFTGLELAQTVARGIITDNYLPAQLDLRYIRYKKYHKPLNGLEPCDVECISDSRDNRGDGGSPGLPSLGDVHLTISHLKDAISEFPNLGRVADEDDLVEASDLDGVP